VGAGVVDAERTTDRGPGGPAGSAMERMAVSPVFTGKPEGNLEV